MSKIQGAALQKLGVEMLSVGFLSVALAIFIYIGIFKIVAAEYAQLADAEEPGNEDVRGGLSETTVSRTTAANTSANITPGIVQHSANRRIFRTRRHGGGESIVSFAVDLENNNFGRGAPTAAAAQGHGHQQTGGGKGRGREKGRYDLQSSED